MKLSRAAMDAEDKLHRFATAWCLFLRRSEAGLSQDEVAAEAYLSRGSVQNAEHGRNSLRDCTKRRICRALGILEIELDAQVMRVEAEWQANGLAEKVMKHNSLAEVLAAKGGLILGEGRHRHGSEIRLQPAAPNGPRLAIRFKPGAANQPNDSEVQGHGKIQART